MNKKIGFIFGLILLLVNILFSAPLAFSQTAVWHSVKISTCGKNVIENNLLGASLEYTIVAPPSGSEITNLISATNVESGENYTVNLSPDERVALIYAYVIVDKIIVEPIPESTNYIIEFEGEAWSLMINGSTIPEFPPILIAPMFMIATLLALVYKRKRTK